MDDGARVGKGMKLCTNSFTFEDCTRLCTVLNELFGLKVTTQSAGYPGQFHLYV